MATTNEPSKLSPGASSRRKGNISSKSSGMHDPALTAALSPAAAADTGGAVNQAFVASEDAPGGQDVHAIEMQSFQSPLSSGVATYAASPAEAARQPETGKKPVAEAEPAWRKNLPYAAKIGSALLFHAYLGAGIALTWHSTPDYCSDVKFLTVVTGIVYFFLLWYGVAALLDRFSPADNVRRSILDSLLSAKAKHRWL